LQGVKVKEIFTMWRHTQMVVLVALSAAIYAAILIPFKGFPIIPGAVEIRPANVIPFVVGLLFGPAGAWGSAIGNLIGDFFGTLSPGSIGGFVGNFFLALLPYKLWGAYFRRDENSEPNMDSGKKLAVYVAIAIIASLVCSAIISWWVALLQIFPFVPVLILIVVNNAIMGIVLGPILLRLIYPRVKRWGLLWTEIMEPEEVSAARAQRTGNILVWVGGVGAVLTGVILGTTNVAPAGLGIGLALLPFLILVVVGTFMLGGREQVEAIREEMAAEESDR
jgi:energy-coupling factor transport system substrate-specific component